MRAEIVERLPRIWHRTLRPLPPLVVAFALGRVPVSMPEYSLDGSWGLALNEAVGAGIAFGRRIVFTYGPASPLLTGAFHPRTIWVSFAVVVVLAAGAAWLFWRCFGERSQWAALAFAVLLLGAHREASLAVLPASFVVGLVGQSSGDARTTSGPVRPARELVVAAGLIGILLAVKGTFFPVGVLSIGALVILGWERRRDVLTPLSVGMAAIVGFAATWISYGQALSDVWPYVLGVMAVSSGYSEAMQLGWAGTTRSAVSAYLLGAFICAATFASSGASGRGRWLAGLVVSLTVFTLLKLGFVRADHMPIATAGLFLMAALIVPTAPRNLRAAIGFTSVLSVAVIGLTVSWSAVFAGLPVHQLWTIGDHARGWGAIIERDQSLASRFESRLAEVATEHPLPALPGTVDIYSYDQMRVLASKLDWDPRPVFQSYSAYTPALAERNARHLRSPSGPDWVVFSPQPIDGRYPSSEDGPSWLELLRRYDASEAIGDALILRRAPSDDGLVPLGHTVTSGRLDERIDVDVAGAIVFVQIDAEPSWLGNLALFGFRSDPLGLWVELSTGETRIYRLPMGLAEAGFILSPFVDDLPQVASLFASPSGSSVEGLAKVTAFRVITERPELWQPRFEVRWQTFDRG